MPGTHAPLHGLLRQLLHLALHPATDEENGHAPNMEWREEAAPIGFDRVDLGAASAVAFGGLPTAAIDSSKPTCAWISSIARKHGLDRISWIGHLAVTSDTGPV